MTLLRIVVLALLFPLHAFAQQYPVKPVRIIVDGVISSA